METVGAVLYIVGDYESAIIFDQSRSGYVGICQNKATAASHETCFHFLWFMVLPSGALLKQMQFSTPLLDRNGNPMACCGCWGGESSDILAQSAIAKVHGHFEMLRNVYEDFCTACREKTCLTHSAPRMLRKGCPTKTKLWENAVKGLLQYIKDYSERCATVAFLPCDLRTIKDCIRKLFANNIDGKFYLMIWTIILVGVKQFLLINEVLAKTLENFAPDLTNVTESNIVALINSVRGKSDTARVFLMLWDDEECCVFSPTWAIHLGDSLGGDRLGGM
jgi:hypothetical protein